MPFARLVVAVLSAITLWPAMVSGGQDEPGASGGEVATALQRAFDELAEAGFSGAVLVVRGERELLSAAAGLADRAHGRVNSADTIYDVGSITKQFTAAAILRLAEQEKLSTDDTLDRFFDDVPADKRKIRLHHLLTHTSGLPSDVPVGSRTTDRDELVRTSLAAEVQAPPGKQFVYNNVGYLLLAAIIEIVSEQSYETFVSEHLFAHAGMRSSGFLRTAGLDTARVARGYEGKTAFGPGDQGWYSWGLRGAGGVLSTTRDLMIWWRALQTETILSNESREQLFRPFKLDYACGWWVRDDPSVGRVIEHGGTTRGFEAEYTHYPDQDLHVIVLCNDRGRARSTASTLFEVASGRRETVSATPLSEAELAAFAGEFEALRGGKIVVHADGDALTLEPDDPVIFALELGSADAKLTADEQLAARAQQLVALLDAGDAEGAQALMTTRWPGWNQQMVKVWDAWRDERGELEGADVLGSSDGSRTLVRLKHARRSVVWSLEWDKDVLVAWSLNGGLPEAGRFRWRSGAVFACPIDPGLGRGEYELVFDRESDGRVKQLTLTGRALRLQARRLR